jgi:protein gp37
MNKSGPHPLGYSSSVQRQVAPAPSERPGPEQWYDAIWEPTVGCSACSPGCDHCDALGAVTLLARMGGRTGADYAGLTSLAATEPVWTGEIRVRQDLLTWPLYRSKPRRILVDPLSDLFHENLANPTIDKLHAVMAVAHWHLFLVLSKRAERMAGYYCDPETPRRIAVEMNALSALLLPDPVPQAIAGRGSTRRRLWASGLSQVRYRPGEGPIGLQRWPLPNLWPGVSVEDEARMGRIRHLVETPAVLRWVCFEPLLGPVLPEAVPIGDACFDALSGGYYRLDGRGRAIVVAGPPRPPVDWIVVGGEIGAAARPMQPDWARAVRDRCIAAEIPFFFEQWGEWAPAAGGGERMVRIGRRAAGRLLDGRRWNELPASMPSGCGAAGPRRAGSLHQE